MIFILAGLVLIAIDYSSLEKNYRLVYQDITKNLIPKEIKDEEPNPRTKEKLRSELIMADEYLKQNSVESIRKALDIYNKIYSFAQEEDLKQLAKFGLSYSLYRLNDENRSLQHLRELKSRKIINPALEEEIDYLLGRILLLGDNEEEGKAILQNLLAKTNSKELKSRIHSTFGDYYYKKKNYQRAQKNYFLALRYNPDHLYAERVSQNLKQNKKYLPIEYENYNFETPTGILDKVKEKQKEEKKSKDTKTIKKQETTQKIERNDKQDKKDKQEEKQKTSQDKIAHNHKEENEQNNLSFSEQIEMFRRELKIAVANIYQKSYLEAYNQLVQLERKIMNFLQKKSLSEKQKSKIYEILENVYFRLGELQETQKEKSLARIYYERVITNPNELLDQMAMIKIGISYFDDDEFQKAYQYFKKAYDFDPRGKYSQEALEWLKETEKILLEKQGNFQ